MSPWLQSTACLQLYQNLSSLLFLDIRSTASKKDSCLRIYKENWLYLSPSPQLHSSTSFSEFLHLKKQVLKPPLKSIMPYLSCSSTNRLYGEHLSLKEHLISDCYPRMLTCVGNSSRPTMKQHKGPCSWVKFSTYLNLPLKLDIPVTFQIHPFTSNPGGCPSLPSYDSWSTKKTSVKFPPPRNYLNISLTTIQALLTIVSKPLVHSAPGHQWMHSFLPMKIASRVLAWYNPKVRTCHLF